MTEIQEPQGAREPEPFTPAWFEKSILANEYAAQRLVAEAQQKQAELAELEVQFQQRQGMIALLKQQQALVSGEV